MPKWFQKYAKMGLNLEPFPGKPGGSLGPIYPLRARRRPGRVGICVVALSACIPSAYLPSACVLSFFLFVLVSLVDCVCLPGPTGKLPLRALRPLFRTFFRIDFLIDF